MEEVTQRCQLQVSEDLERFYNSKEFNDVTFIVGNEQFQANKSILAARSPTFFSMFSLDMKEKNENSVKIEDIDPQVFKEMLKFLYTGKLQDYQFSEGLLIVADKYAIESLKKLCEKSLSDGISIENAMDTLQLADSYNAFDLKQKALQFIVDHPNDIIKTDGFKNIEQTRAYLFKELFCALAKKLDDVPVDTTPHFSSDTEDSAGSIKSNSSMKSVTSLSSPSGSPGSTGSTGSALYWVKNM